jgi:hypothetical protein
VKKLLAIFCLCLFFISTIGYYYISHISILFSNTQLQSAIDNNTIHQQDIQLIKVPIQLPYQIDWNEFEKIEGSVAYNGITYKYIGRKLTKDTMVYQCVPNLQQKAIENNVVHFTKSQGGEQKNSETSMYFFKLLTTVFNQSTFFIGVPTNENISHNNFSNRFFVSYSKPFIGKALQPPRFV